MYVDTKKCPLESCYYSRPKNDGQKGLTRLTFSKYYCTLHWVYRNVYFILDNYIVNIIIILVTK